MKYEYLCGYESDFFTMPENIIAVVQLDHCVQGLTEFNQIIECGKPVLAMRRIIAEPKHWTVEDKKAGRLPEVGSIGLTNYGRAEYLGNDSTSIDKCHVRYEDGYCERIAIEKFTPLETPEEKAARLREEWCIKALSSCSILSGMQKYELKRLGGYIEDIYDALLSGELPIPSKGGE